MSTTFPTLRRFAARAALTTTIAVGVALACTAQGASQVTPPPANPVMLKRIAEAIDGNRTGKLVYVVVSLEPTSPVLAVTPNLDSAQALATRGDVKAAVFGPYLTIADKTDGFISACVHDRASSRMHIDRCSPPVERGGIVGMQLVLERSGGARDTIPLSPDADAIFLGMAAIDKFAIPYYVRTIGVADANAMRTDFEQRFTPGGAPKP